MREIEFRGKTADGQEVYGDLIHDDAGVLIRTRRGEMFRVDEETVAQLIARDRFGRKVYEGDEVADVTGRMNKRIYLVTSWVVVSNPKRQIDTPILKDLYVKKDAP